MKIRSLIAALLATALLPVVAQAQTSFTLGDLIVYRVGNGTATLGSSATAVFLDEYNASNGSLVQSIALPSLGNNTTGNFSATASGSATSEGMITLSQDGQYIAFSGYSANAGLSSVASSNAASVLRVGGTMNYNGTIVVNPLASTSYNGNNIRGAYAENSTAVWTAGAGAVNGVWFANGTSAVNLLSGGLRAVNAAGGQLYIDTGSAIQSVGTGLPTTGGQANTTIVSTTGTTSAFFFADLSNSVAGPDTLYVANNGANTTAIQKYTLLGNGTWVATGTASIGALGNASTGAFGLTGAANGSDVTIYGTTSNAIFDLTDSSGYDGTLSGTAASLASVAISGNEAFRGIAFAPTSMAVVPEPGAMALLIGLGSLAGAGVLRRKQKPAATNALAN